MNGFERRVVITGATGFVGSHLVEALAAAGAEMAAIVRSTSDTRLLERHGVEALPIPLMDRAGLARAVAGADTVFHLAAVTRARSAAEYAALNVDGTRTLVEAVLGADPRPRRVVYLSSLSAAGPARELRPVRHDDAPHPLTAYGRSKLEAERVCLTTDDTLEVVALRAPAVYGPRDRDLYTYFRLAAIGLLPVPSGPDRPVQLIHAADLATALIRAAAAPGAGGVYHVAESRAYAWAEVAELIRRAIGCRARIVRVPPPLVHWSAGAAEIAAGLTRRATIFNREKARELLAPGWLCETDRARRELDFTARIPLADGLAATAAWYREQGWL